MFDLKMEAKEQDLRRADKLDMHESGTCEGKRTST